MTAEREDAEREDAEREDMETVTMPSMEQLEQHLRDLGVTVSDSRAEGANGANVLLFHTLEDGRYHLMLGGDLPLERRLWALEAMVERLLWEAPDLPWQRISDDAEARAYRWLARDDA